MRKKIIIIGAGGHGKVIADLALKCGYDSLGFLDDVRVGKFINYSILGKICDVENYLNEYEFIIAIGNNRIRQKISEVYNKANWAALIHPYAQIGQDVEIEEGSVVFANAVINASAKIGKHCIVNTSAVVEHDNILEDFVHISPGAVLCGTVFIGKRTHVGAGAIVRNNVNICEDCVIGAGAVAIKDIKASGVYIGIPAREMRLIENSYLN